MNEDYIIPVYLIMGFLEAGKTTFIREVLESGDFTDGDKGVYICCEEGECEIPDKLLKANKMQKIEIEDMEQLQEPGFFANIAKEYQPERVFIEFNGMWDPDLVISADMPEHWEVFQTITLIDARSFASYLQNMRSIIGNVIKCSEVVIFNRCSKDQDLPSFRRSVKAANTTGNVMMQFISEDGEYIDLGKDVPPYDLNAPIIEISDMDYGLWYLDAQENPDRYMGKVISFTARYCASAKPGEKYFIPGRHIMTCCEDDIEFLGFLCNCIEVPDYEHGEWVKVDVYFDYGECEMYGPGEEGPVLELLKIEDGVQPEQELVAFT
jgi:hypothetical protein